MSVLQNETESKTYSHLILDAILPNLQPSQIDELRTCNRQLNLKIEKIRLDLPGWPLHTVRFKFDDEQNCFVLDVLELVGENANRVNKLRVGEEKLLKEPDEVMKYLAGVRPSAFMSCGSGLECIDSKWIGMIGDIVVNKFKNLEDFRAFIPKINCHTFRLFHGLPEMYGDEILENMPHVKCLSLPDIKISPEFFLKLAKKGMLGPGIERFKYGNYRDNEPVDAEKLREFVHKNRYATLGAQGTYDTVIEIDRVSGSRRQFFRNLNMDKWCYGYQLKVLNQVLTGAEFRTHSFPCTVFYRILIFEEQ